MQKTRKVTRRSILRTKKKGIRRKSPKTITRSRADRPKRPSLSIVRSLNSGTDKIKLLILLNPRDEIDSSGSTAHSITLNSLEKYADVRYWSKGGRVPDILRKNEFQPDFILYYDTSDEETFTPNIADLDQTDISKGFFVPDSQNQLQARKNFIEDNKINLIFTSSASDFQQVLPGNEEKHRFWPFSDSENDSDTQQFIASVSDFLQQKNNITQISTRQDVPRRKVKPIKKKLKILILVKPFAKTFPKHQHKFDMIKAIGQFAHVKYWHKNGNILRILKKIKMKPDFIFHYDPSWNNAFSPKITNLHKVNIPKGTYVLDVHWKPKIRKAYFNRMAKPDLIFSASKYPFLKVFPAQKSRFRWWPFGVNPSIIKDYKLNKDIEFSLMGLLNQGRYKFREAVLRKMSKVRGFVHHRHPGHRAQARRGVLINQNYAKAINRSKMFFTCGGNLKIPVAKFFEGPGCKSLLMAEPNRDIVALGFKNGQNYVACSASNVLQKALYYQKHPIERERITLNGYKFIHTYHTNHVRARQFVSAIAALLARKKTAKKSAKKRTLKRTVRRTTGRTVRKTVRKTTSRKIKKK